MLIKKQCCVSFKKRIFFLEMGVLCFLLLFASEIGAVASLCRIWDDVGVFYLWPTLARSAAPLIALYAGASYWVYLVHLPVIFAIQISLMGLNLHWSVKLMLSVGMALSIALFTYHLFVRGHGSGRFLNGAQ